MKKLLIFSLLAQASVYVWAQAPVTEINTSGNTAIITQAAQHGIFARSQYIPVYAAVEGTGSIPGQRQVAIEGYVASSANNTANQYVGVAGYAQWGGVPPSGESYDVGVYGSGKRGVWGKSAISYGHGVMGEGFYGVYGSNKNHANGVGVFAESYGSAALVAVGYNQAYAAQLFGGKTYIEHLAIGPVASISGFTYTLDVGGRMLLRSGGTNQTSAGTWYNNNLNTQLRAFTGMRDDNEFGIYSQPLADWLMRFNVSTGSICSYSAIANCSDIRLKTNLLLLQNSLSKLSQLHGYNYQWSKHTQLGTQTGLIAQDVQKVFPELVLTDEEGYLSVNYTGLIPHLLEAVNELRVKNEKLEAQISTLQSKIKP